ncbi:MAG: hypothetical protein MJ054_00245 [Clostridia bacterium]|nr:hypothetical protein [Clostridia bacterium]
MKLIQCHVENFGKLKNFDYNFTDGFNRIKEDNGWGKSTFATFIKAMFYGLPVTTKKNIDENERKKYLPWQGGNYGGNLIIEVNQKQYKIERFFGKNKAEDTFNLFDVATGKKTQDFTENTGVEIFGLDSDAFERSSYIPQKLLDSNINESMAQKLTNIIQGTTEKFNYEDAIAQLNKKRSNLSNHKNSGTIDDLKNQITDVISEIRELENREKSLPIIQNQIDSIDAEIVSLTKEQGTVKQQIEEYYRQEQKRANQELFDELKRKVSTTQTQIERFEAVLNHQQPTIKEIEEYQVLDKNLLAKENEMQVKSANDYVQHRYDALANYFGENVPSLEKTNQIYQDVIRYNTLKSQVQTVDSHHVVGHNKKRQWCCLGLAVVALFGVLGGVLTLKTQIALGITFFVLGGVLLLASGYLSLVNMINEKTNSHQNINYEQLQKNQSTLLELEQTIVTFLKPYESTEDYLVAITRVNTNLQEYLKLQEQITVNKRDVKVLLETITDEKKRLGNYLVKFNFATDQQNNTEKLVMLKQIISDLVDLRTQLKIQNKELEQFKIAKNFDEKERKVADVDVQVLKQKEIELQNCLDEKREMKSRLVVNINQITDALSKISELENSREELESNLKVLEQELFAVVSAIEFLKTSNESLSTKFLAPMKNGLCKYLTMIADKNFDNLNLDTDFNIAFEEYGKLREASYYSKGYQNMINLCMRFALIDVLYQQEKPFIILDDPFINLDEAKINKAKQFLQKISHDYQLIYFACHESR